MSGPSSHIAPAPAHLNGQPANAEDVQRLRIGMNLHRDYLTGPEILMLMRRSGCTIRSVAKARGLTMKRVREAREVGVSGYLSTCEWIEFTCGNVCFSGHVSEEMQREANRRSAEMEAARVRVQAKFAAARAQRDATAVAA